MSNGKPIVHVIGGGLAGSEAAWQIAQAGVSVILHEMRPHTSTEAHNTSFLGELVCSNSLRSDDNTANAVGLLHDELRKCKSLILSKADSHQVPAGGALAVDRDGFASAISQALETHPLVKIEREEIKELPLNSDGTPREGWDYTIVASGPLTSAPLSASIQKITDISSLSFFDAIAPIVYFDSIDMSKAWRQSRYDKVGPGGDGSDYINCAMDKQQYETFIHELLEAPKTEFKEWEKTTPYFEGCLPIEVMASRGADTLRYGPMKPVGLTNPHTQARPYAVVQLRQDNALGTLYNLVGFQTKLKYTEQKRIFGLIPGLENAEFARLGGMHRNTFLNSPLLLEDRLRLKKAPSLRFAGQITGVEGYVESTAMGLLAARFIIEDIKGQKAEPPPRTSAMGALLAHITGNANAETFQPMNVNFGLFPNIENVRHGRDRKLAYTERAKKDFDAWLSNP